ncbi:hypothetical protein NECID01_1492 [Nematocida sp. AWRm77]|nr:hypothetical protein NECID01_1492 [Nematocida sp. AWRm77]
MRWGVCEQQGQEKELLLYTKKEFCRVACLCNPKHLKDASVFQKNPGIKKAFLVSSISAESNRMKHAGVFLGWLLVHLGMDSLYIRYLISLNYSSSFSAFNQIVLDVSQSHGGRHVCVKGLNIKPFLATLLDDRHLQTLCPTLEELRLCQNSYTDKDLDSVTLFISRCSRLKKVALVGYILNSTKLKKILEKLSCLENLSIIVTRDCTIKDVTQTPLLFYGLRSLDLSLSEIQAKGSNGMFSDFLKSIPNIEELSLSNFYINTKEAEEFVNLRALRKLTLSNVFVNNLVTQELLKALPKIEDLAIKIEDFLASTAESFKNCCNLQNLQIRGTKIKRKDGIKLLKNLSYTKIKSLDLEIDDFDSKVADGFKNCTNLRELRMNHTVITGSILDKLLEFLPKIEELTIKLEDLGNDKNKRYFKNSKSLKRLTLISSFYENIAVIEAFFQNLPKLDILTIETNIFDLHMASLVKSIKPQPSNLVIKWKTINQNSWDILFQALLKNSVEYFELRRSTNNRRNSDASYSDDDKKPIDFVENRGVMVKLFEPTGQKPS